MTLDIGHTPRASGAVSARGKPEYLFNRRFVHELAAVLRKTGVARVAILNDAGANVSLRARAAKIATIKDGILLSIHHDSVQPIYMHEWTYKGRKHHFSNRFKGYSLFVAGQTRIAKESIRLARSIGGHLRVAGFSPSLHHAEKIRGEGRTLLDKSVGLYRFDELAVLKHADIPAVLIEVGIIVNQDEELELEDPRVRGRLEDAISRGIKSFCDAPRPVN